MPLRRPNRRTLFAAAMGAFAVIGAALPVTPRPVAAEPVVGPSSGRYIVELDPQSVSPWLARVAGDFGDALRVHTVKSRVVQQVPGHVVFDYGDLPFVAVETDDPAALAATTGVLSVKPDVPIRRALDTSLGVINATSAQLETALSGTRADGSGTTVVIIDDGIDRNHPFLRDDAGNSRVVYEACYNQTTCAAGATGAGSAAHAAGNWHGTHVAGIAAGTQLRVGTRTFRGVARSTEIVAIRVFNDNGSGSLVDVDRGLLRVRELIDSGLTTVSAINMSLGTDVFFTGTCDVYRTQTTTLIDELRQRGVVTVVAAGNSSKRTEMSWPACISGALPVGATTTADAVAWFSNVSQRLADAGLMAPGESICSSVPTAVASSGFGCAGGTSMAAPHVAGALALLAQATASATADARIATARLTPTTVTDTRTSGSLSGFERLDVAYALASTQLDTGTLDGVLRDATDVSGGVPLAATPVTVALTPTGAGSPLSATVVTDNAGGYVLTGVPVGSWNVTASVLGYPATAAQAFTLVAGSAPRATVDVTVSVQTGAVNATVSALPGYPAQVAASLSPASGSPWSARTQAATTDANGAFTLAGIRPGEWDLTVSSDSFVSSTQRITVVGAATTSSTLVMTALTGSLSLSLANDDSAIALGATEVMIEATPVGAPGDRGAVTAAVTTSAQGVATVPALRIGSWQVTVSADSHDPASTTVTIAQGATASATLTLPVRRGSVTARIAYPTGTAPASAPGELVPLSDVLEGIPTALTLTPSGGTPWSAFTITDTVVPGGDTFNVPGVRPGDWVVSAAANGYRQVGGSQAVAVVAGGTASIESLAMEAVPYVASISPGSGSVAGGTSVTFTGLHLDDATSVTFGGVAGTSLRTGTGTTLSVVTPARGSSGTVTVVVTTTRGTANSTFTYTAAAAPTPTPTPTPTPVPAPAPPSSGGGASSGSDPAPVTATIAAPSGAGGSVAVDVELADGVMAMSFSGVAGAGEVRVQERSGEPTSGTRGLRLVGRHLEITASGVDFDQAELCVPFSEDDAESLDVDPSRLRLMHFVGDLGRRDITTRVDTARRVICGLTDSFSPFAIGVPATERVAGDDRYATAVALSASFYPDGVTTVYLASGMGFADALAAGAAAAADGAPVLLTSPQSLPAVVRAELVRLGPSQVVLVGGASAVAVAVELAVRAALPRAVVTRLQGADRYATAVEVSRRAFTAGVAKVYVATGLSFPDALAGAAAAGRDGAPVLLVPGAIVPQAVATELTRLRPREVILLGGTSALGTGISTGVAAAVPSATITRLQGSDRYATAASVAGTFPIGSPVFAATGRTFPDALAGAAIAGRQRGPVIVAPDGVLPASIDRALARLRPARLVVLGGVAAVSTEVELQLAAFLP